MRFPEAKALSCAVIFLLAGILTGCGLFVEDPNPQSARLKLTQGQEGVTVELITSVRFVSQGGTPDRVEVLEGDTTLVEPPVDQSFDITETQRFFARLATADSSRGIQMQAWIDGEKRYDKTATSAPQDSVLRFIYYHLSSDPGEGGDL